MSHPNLTRTTSTPSPALRKLGAAAGVLASAIILGCMCFSVGNRTHEICTTDVEGLLVQTGQVRVLPGEGQDVYYPIPYAQPPNLEISSTFDDCKVLEQKADHFRICRPDKPFGATVTWKARGVRVPVSPPLHPLPPPSAALPAEPIPVPAK